MTTAQKILRLLKELRLDRKSVAKKVGVAYPNFRSYLRDVSPSVPGVHIALKIARALNVSVDWLYDDDQEWPPGGAARSNEEIYDTVRTHTAEIRLVHRELLQLFRELRSGLDALKEDRDGREQRNHVGRIIVELFSISCENETNMKEFEQFWFDLHELNPYSDFGVSVQDTVELISDLEELGIATSDEYPWGFVVWMLSYSHWGNLLARDFQALRQHDRDRGTVPGQPQSARPRSRPTPKRPSTAKKPKPRTTGKKSAPAKPQRPKRPPRS